MPLAVSHFEPPNTLARDLERCRAQIAQAYQDLCHAQNLRPADQWARVDLALQYDVDGAWETENLSDTWAQADISEICGAFADAQEQCESILQEADGPDLTLAKRRAVRDHLQNKLGHVTHQWFKKQFAEQQQERARLNAIFDASQDCLKILDPKGRILALNRGGLHLLELKSRQLVLQKEWLSVWQTPDKIKAANALAEVQAGRSARFVGFCPTAQGTPKHWDVMLSRSGPHDDDPILVLSRDITATVASQQQLQIAVERATHQNDLREKFVATLSHDLRNPLTAARSSAQIIQRYPKNHGQHQRLAERIVRTLDRADSMTTDLLDANRIRAGEPMRLATEPTNLQTLVDDSLKDLVLSVGDRFVVKEQGASHAQPFAFDLISSGPGLRRVIDNLATNAIKYGDPSSPVTLTLSSEHDQVGVDVHNFGPPISAHEQRTLFSAFSRTHSAQHSGKRGWGLGLTLVRGLVEALGGKVWVTSAPVVGTTFSVRIPRHPPSQKHAEPDAPLAVGPVAEASADECAKGSEPPKPSTTQSYLSSILDAIGDGVIATTAAGCISSMNDVAASMCGVDAEDAKGQYLRAILRLQDTTGSAVSFDPASEALETGRAVAFAHGYRIERDKDRIPVEGHASPIRDAHGSILGVVVVIRDVSLSFLHDEQTQLLSWVTEYSTEVILTFAQDLQITYCNPAGRKALNIDPNADALGKLTDYLQADQRQLCAEIILVALQKKRRWQGNLKFASPALKHTIYLTCDFFAIVDKDTDWVCGFVLSGQMHDLQPQEMHSISGPVCLSGRVPAAANIGVWCMDKQKRVIHVSQHARRMLNIAEIEGPFDIATMLSLAQSEDLEKAEDAFEQALNNGARIDFSCNIVVASKNDVLLRFEGAACQSPLSDDRIALAGTCRVVARRLDAPLPKPLDDADDPLRARDIKALVDSMPFYFCILQGEPLRFVYANPVYKQRWDGMDIVGRGVVELYPDVSESGFLAIIQEVIRTGQPLSVKSKAMSIDGAEHVFDCSYAARRSANNKADGVIVLVADVTHHKATRDLAEASARLSESLLNLSSHELRTPLTSLRLQLQLADRTLRQNADIQALQRHFEVFVTQAKRSVGRLMQTADNILDCFGPLLEESAPLLDLTHVASSIVDDFCRDPANKHLKISFQHYGRVCGHWPQAQIRQILRALIGNAIKHGRESNIRVSVATMGYKARMTVEDAGPGIDKASHELIFRLCGRAHGGQHAEGLGLGLFLCKRLVNHLSGYIYVDSALGRGTRLVVDLPLTCKIRTE